MTPQDDILDSVTTLGVATVAQLADHTGRGYREIRAALSRLTGRGALRVVPGAKPRAWRVAGSQSDRPALPSTTEARDRIVARVAEVGGWVSVADLAPWMAGELGATRMRGEQDLRLLVERGRLERRATVVEGTWRRRYQYRVPA